MRPRLFIRVLFSSAFLIALCGTAGAVVLPSDFVLAGRANSAADALKATGPYRLPEHTVAPEQIEVPAAPVRYRTVASADGKHFEQIPIVEPAPAPIRATDFRAGVYLRMAAGVFFADDYDVGGFGDQKFSSLQITSDAGFRFAGGIGYRFNDWFALEFESGFLVNEVSQIIAEDVKPTNSNEEGNSITAGSDDITDADQWQIPFMVNAYFFIPTGTRLRPYIGGGIGGIYHHIDAIIRDPKDNGHTLDDFNLEIDDFDFAYQAFAGLRYVITPGDRVNELDPTHPIVEVDLGYYWLANDTGAQNHSIMAGLAFTF